MLPRFFDQRRTLARLQHPNIARLFDGGMFEGRLYFAMEYIEGEPIVEYANRLELSLKARIQLFLQVCDAVEYAHRNLILHGDIKAANILVDSSGAPKLLDFGIARLFEEGDARQIELGQSALGPNRIGTERAHAAIRQPRASTRRAADHRYRCLCSGPAAFRIARSASPLIACKPFRVDEISRVICEEPPPRPSTLAGRTRGARTQRRPG